MRKLLLILLVLTQFSYGKEATVSFLRGKAVAKMNGKEIILKKGSTVQELTTIETQSGSVVKVSLPDKSKLTIGPKSSIKIEKFRTADEPSLVSVASGMLRSSVPKENNKDTKMLIRTKSAVMGIRGTELQTIFNPANGVSSTVTFEGDVAMAKAAPNMDSSAMLNSLSKDSVSIGPGQVSMTNFSQGNAITPPTKISPVQFNSLKRNQDFKETKMKSADNNKRVVPPGLSNKKVAATAEGIKEVIKAAPQAVASETSAPAPAESPKAEGAPTAGGYVDLKTGLYVPPPPGSTFDPNSGVYVPSEAMGKVDPATGEFVTAENVKLTDDGKFVDSSTGEVSTSIPSVENPTSTDTASLDVAPPTETTGPQEDVIVVVDETNPNLANTVDAVIDQTSNTISDTTDANAATKSQIDLNIKVILQ